MADDTVVLVCPAGSQDAAISEGTTSYECWHHHASGHWLTRVPMTVAQHLCFNAGFYKAPDALQGERPS